MGWAGAPMDLTGSEYEMWKAERDAWKRAGCAAPSGAVGDRSDRDRPPALLWCMWGYGSAVDAAQWVLRAPKGAPPRALRAVVAVVRPGDVAGGGGAAFPAMSASCAVGPVLHPGLVDTAVVAARPFEEAGPAVAVLSGRLPGARVVQMSALAAAADELLQPAKPDPRAVAAACLARGLWSGEASVAVGHGVAVGLRGDVDGARLVEAVRGAVDSGRRAEEGPPPLEERPGGVLWRRIHGVRGRFLTPDGATLWLHCDAVTGEVDVSDGAAGEALPAGLSGAFVLWGPGVNLATAQDVLCRAGPLAPKREATLTAPPASVMDALSRELRAGPAPEGWAFDGWGYVDAWGRTRDAHPGLDEAAARWLAEHNAGVGARNAEAEAAWARVRPLRVEAYGGANA